MRWNIGGYEVKINPSKYSRSNDSQVDPIFTASGVSSTANTTYDASQEFQIEIFEKKTTTSSSLSGIAKYRSMSMNPSNSRFYLLRDSDSKIDVMTYDNKTVLRNLTITASSGGVIGTGVPTSIANDGTNILMLYNEKSGSNIIATELAVLDDNAKTIRKYRYDKANNPDGQGTMESLASFPYDTWTYGLNKHGAVFKMETSMGKSMEVFKTYDYAINFSKGLKPYKSIAIFGKAGYKYIALLRDNGDIMFYSESGNPVACAKTNVAIFKEIAYSPRVGLMKLLTDNSIYQVYPNTSSIDIEIIRDRLRKGEIVVTDENGMKLKMSIKSFGVERIKHFDEGRYIVDIDGKVIEVPQGFKR